VDRTAFARHVVAQLFVAAATLRGTACSFEKNYVIPVAATTTHLSEAQCEAVCRMLLEREDGCSEFVKVESCQFAHAAPPPKGAAQSDASESAKFVFCTMKEFPSRCGAGRRPSRLLEVMAARGPASGAGRHLAAMARLEAASVTAFRELATELVAHGAPRDLTRRSLAAMHDEARHAALSARLAERYGADAETAVVGDAGIRSAADLLIHNAVEGCVSELFGAALLHAQAAAATDPAAARALREIAADEERHAALSLDIDAWLLATADASARSRRREAVQGALEQIVDDAERDPTGGIDEIGWLAGWQRAHLGRRMAELLRA
jgi:hypothetical protein